MAKPVPAVPAARLALYEKLVATNPAVQRKGAANPYTSLNGHMFSFLTKEGQLALRLSKEDREAFVARFKTKPCIQYGAVMKEYVIVPDSLLKKTREAKKYFDMSYAYVGSLKPKPTKRKSSSKKTTKKPAKKTAKKPAKKAKKAAKKTAKKKTGRSKRAR